MEWISNHDNWKQMAVPVGLGLGIYGLSGLIPGLKKSPAARAGLAVAGAGLGGVYNKDISDWITNKWSAVKNWAFGNDKDIKQK